MTEGNIGIDISKSHLDAHRLEDETAQRFENTSRGFRALIKWLGAIPVARIVYEPTGPYHRALEKALSGKVPLVKVNPLQARRFAQSCGTRAKTDAVDARILARMGAALALEPDAPISEKLHDLRDLQVARTGLVKERTRLRNRGQVQTIPVLKRQTKARLALLERQISELDKEIAKHIADDQPTARKRDILCSIPGLGPIASALILTPALRLRSGRSGLTACHRHPVRAALTPKSAPWTERRPEAWPALSPTAVSPASGKASRSSAAGANLCAMPSTCQPWLPCVSTPTSRLNTPRSAKLESPPKSPSSQSCESCRATNKVRIQRQSG